MPFIGQEPITGAFHKLDAITTSATATYNLQLGGGAYSPASANHLLVSLNGVIQAPQDSFTVSGSQITFDSALTSSDSIDFIMAYGDVLNIGTPSDGSVNTNQLANSAVTDAKIAGMAASKLTGALPALDGSALTGTSSLTFPNSTSLDITGGLVGEFTGIPSDAKRVRIYLYDISTASSNTLVCFQLGHAGGYIAGSTSYNYRNSYGNVTSDSSAGNNYSSTAFKIDGWGSADNRWFGYMDLFPIDYTSTNRIWMMDTQMWNRGFTEYDIITYKGYVSLGDKSTQPLDRFKIFNGYGSSPANFDGNSRISIDYMT